MIRMLRSRKFQRTKQRPFFACAAGATCIVLILSSPTIARAGSREAVARAVGATVAIEWKADKPAEQPAEQADRADKDVGQPADKPSEPQPGAPPAARLPALPQGREVIHFMRGDKLQHRVELRQGGWVSALKQSGAPDLSLASGTVVSADGLIVAFSPTPAASPESGHHTVTFDDGRTFTARLVVNDRRNGLELLKIDAHDLPHLTPADEDAQLGDQVYATFATDARQRAAAQGMVAARNQSRKGRSARLLQVDAKVGRMSAGGPLVDGDGRLVGILVSRSEAEGTSFAVPAKAVAALIAARQADALAVIEHGFLGVQLDQHEVDGKSQVIMRPMGESPATAAGVREGDVLLMIDGEAVSSAEDAAAIISQHAPGDTVALVFERDGKREARAITLGRRPTSIPTPQNQAEDALRFTRSRVVEEGPGAVILFTETEPGQQQARVVLQPQPVVSTLRVERSDVEKQLDSVGQNVQSLSEQVKKLTEEVQRLREQLSRDGDK